MAVFTTVSLPVLGRAVAAVVVIATGVDEVVGVVAAGLPPPMPGVVVVEVVLAQSVPTLVDELLLLLELPDVELPPLVLLPVVALPEFAVCELLLLISILLVQFTFVLFDWLESLVVLESGPLLLTVDCAAATPTRHPVLNIASSRV